MRESSKSIQRILLGTVILILFAFAVTVILCWQETNAFALNITVMAGMIFFSLRGLGPKKGQKGIFSLVNDTFVLKTAHDYLENQKRQDLQPAQVDQALLNIFDKEPFIREAFTSYIQEKEKRALSVELTLLQDDRKTQKMDDNGEFSAPKHFLTCGNSDIADFFNVDLLDDSCNSSYNELVGNIMTALGILGTFVGLVFSFWNFGAQSTDVLENITPLISGMKVAFLTSIFGIVASVFYNILFHRVRSEANETLEQFLQCYYRYVSPRFENEAISQVLYSHQQQICQMAQIEENIANTIAKQIATIVPELFKSAVTPHLKTLTDHVVEAQEKLMHAQEDELRHIAGQMIDQMDASLKERFSQFSRSVTEFCQEQEVTRKELLEVTKQLKTSGTELQKTHIGLGESLKTFQNYARALNSAQINLNKSFQSALCNCELLTAQNTKLEQSLNAMVERVDQAFTECGTMNHAMIAEWKLLNHSVDTCGKALLEEIYLRNQQAQRMQESFETAIQRQMEQLKEVSQEQRTALQTSLQQIDAFIQETHTELSVSSKNLEQFIVQCGMLTNTLDQNLIRTEDSMSWNINELQSIQNQFQNLIEAVNDSTEQVSQKMGEYFDQLEIILSRFFEESPNTLNGEKEASAAPNTKTGCYYPEESE